MKILFLTLYTVTCLNALAQNQSDKPLCEKCVDDSRIVSVGSSVTETLYFLNNEKNIVAVDVTSNYPSEAKKLPSVGYIRNLSSEGLLSAKPSIIISEDDIGPNNTIDQLNKLDLDLRIIPEEQTINGIIEKIKCIGQIIGKKDYTLKKIEKELNPVIEKINKKRKKWDFSDKKVMMILSNNGNSIVIAGSNTSGDSFINMLGCKNIFSDVEGWKSVSPENILIRNPDYIILPQKDLHKQSNIDDVVNNEILRKTNAGINDGFILKDGMAILGYGPRTIISVYEILDFIIEER